MNWTPTFSINAPWEWSTTYKPRPNSGNLWDLPQTSCNGNYYNTPANYLNTTLWPYRQVRWCKVLTRSSNRSRRNRTMFHNNFWRREWNHQSVCPIDYWKKWNTLHLSFPRWLDDTAFLETRFYRKRQTSFVQFRRMASLEPSHRHHGWFLGFTFEFHHPIEPQPFDQNLHRFSPTFPLNTRTSCTTDFPTGADVQLYRTRHRPPKYNFTRWQIILFYTPWTSTSCTRTPPEPKPILQTNIIFGNWSLTSICQSITRLLAIR